MAKDLSWKDAVYLVLKEAKAPMHYQLIAQEIADKEYRQNLGATPHVSVSVALRALKDKVVSCSERGMYILKEYEKEFLKGNPIEIEGNTMVGAYGRFWLRENVNWKTRPALLGRQSKTSQDVNFSEQIGIYLLHRGYETVYIGQTQKQTLGTRLYQHTKDTLAFKWDKFSWFGFYKVNDKNGELIKSLNSISIKIPDLADTLEAILIECIEARFNDKSGNNLNQKEYEQSKIITL